MRSAPSVTYPVGRPVLLLWLLVAVGALGGLALILGQIYGLGLWVVGLAAGWLIWALAAIAAWQRQPRGRLTWSAAPPRQSDPMLPESAGKWSWSSSAYQEGVVLRRVERVCDLQVWMLLRLHNPDGARTWLWVERREGRARWDDFRRALWAHT